MIYLFLFVCVIAFIEPYIKFNQRKILYILACLPCLFYAASYSKESFVDIQHYCRYFELFNKNSLIYSVTHYNKESGYIILNKIIGFFTSDEDLFIVVMMVLILIPILYFFYRESKTPTMSLTLYIAFGLFRNCTLLWRQGIAIAIFVVALKFVYERNFKMYLIYILLASTFHITALICLPFYFISKMKITNNTIIISGVISIAVYIAAKPILWIANKVLLNDYALSYNGGITLLVTLWSILLICVFFMDKERIKEEKIKILLWMLIFCVIIQPLALKVSTATRLTNYFKMGIYLILPVLFESVLFTERNKRGSILFFIFVFVIIWLVFLAFQKNISGMILRDNINYIKMTITAMFSSVLPIVMIIISNKSRIQLCGKRKKR